MLQQLIIKEYVRFIVILLFLHFALTYSQSIYSDDTVTAADNDAHATSVNGLRGVYIGTTSDNDLDRTVGKLAVQLVRNGVFQPVGVMDHQFRSGDKFRFEISSSKAGWLYILHRSEAGEPSLLWPRQKPGTNGVYLDENIVKPKQTYIVPATPGVFVFDDKTGRENFYIVIASSKTIPRLTVRGITHESETVKVKSKIREQGNQIVNFRIKGLNVQASKGIKGVIYDPGPHDTDPYIYFSGMPGSSGEFTLIEFNLEHE